MLQLLKRYQEFPPEVIATWPKPNYTNPTTRGPELYIVNSTWLFIATVCVAARLYTRISIRNWFGWDDVFITIAIIAAYGVTACVVLGYHLYGWDRHVYDIPLTSVPASAKLLYASRVIWAVASTSVRFSVMFLYYRLLDHTGLRRYRWILHINSAFMVGVFLAQELTAILACVPPKAMWSWPPILDAKCLNNSTAIFVGAVLNTFSELIVACLPIPIVLALRMSRGQRLAVTSLLSLGFLVVLCGALRTYYIWLTGSTHDPAWWAGPHWITSEVEIDTAMICACAPVLKPMLSRLIKRGPSAARKPNLNESGHQLENDANKRARSLFSKKISHNSENLNSFGTDSSTLQYKNVDIEGIANDGFGYTVTITGGVGVEKEKKEKKRKRVMRALSGSEESLDQEKSAVRGPRHVLSMASTRNAASRGSMRNTVSRGSMAKRRKQNEILDIDDKYDTDIIARKSFEFKESFHEERESTWDPQNPYRRKMTEKDMEIDDRRPSSRTADWAQLGGDIRHKESKLPDLGKNDSKASFDQHHYESPTTAGILRHSSRRFSSKALMVDRSEPNASPQKMFPQQSYPRTIQAQRMNTPSPPPNHFGDRVSPIVQPVNSSQLWASRTPQSTINRANSPRTSAISGNSSEPHMAPAEKGTWSGPLEAVIASAWDQGRTTSFNSSVGAMDGSRMPSLKSKEPKSYQNTEDEIVSMDGESFSLPIEKPPSWHGGPLWARNRAGSASRPRTSQVPISWVGTDPRHGTSFGSAPARPGTAS